MAYEETLNNGLLLRTLRDARDIDRFAEFNATFNNKDEGRTCACFLRHQPARTLDDAWLIEDPSTAEVVATVCLIPWRCRYAGVDLRVAMLEMVLTHRNYRGRGLVRTLINQFHKRVQEQQYDFCLIWGIPYFYRQFGYGYAIDGEIRESLPVWLIPDGPTTAYRLRPAMMADIPQLMAFYGQAMSPLDLHIVRDAVYWGYLLQHAQHPIALLEEIETGQTLGYASILRSAERLVVLESSLPTAAAGMTLLQHLKVGSAAEIQIAWPASSTLVQLARSLGSHQLLGSQWLLRIPDLAHFISRIAPILENRLAASPWRGLNAEMIVNTFREAHRLRFVDGRLAGIDPLGFVDASMGADGGHLCIPPDALLRLIFGYRRLDELFDAWPDLLVKPEARHLFETLWPRLDSYLYTPYHYLGAEASVDDGF